MTDSEERDAIILAMWQAADKHNKLMAELQWKLDLVNDRIIANEPHWTEQINNRQGSVTLTNQA